jgi:hypothetical protein
MEECPLGQALRETEGQKAKNAILKSIQKCELKKSCYCQKNIKLKQVRRK